MESVKDIIVRFLSGQSDLVGSIQDIYRAVESEHNVSGCATWQNSVRRTLYSNTDTFKRVVRGVYMLTGEKSVSLLLDGSGRDLSEIESNSVDFIVTDHPWDCTKSNKGGNRDFAKYDTFQYNISDFWAKARVLKDGCYLAEFLPVESANNWKYLAEIKEMAEKCGLQYYASCIWRSAPEGTKNTGRTTKGVQQIIIFSKGKPRKLSPISVQGYCTHSILPYELYYPVASQAKNRNHPAEKPVELYEYLIKQFTEETEVCLDQFGGSCNMLQAAVNSNRFGIVYEIAEEFITKAKERFNLAVLHAGDIAKHVAEQAEDYDHNMFAVDASGNMVFNI